MKRYTLYIIGILIGCAFSSCRKIEIVVPSEYELVSDGIHPEANPQGMYLVNEGNMGSNKCTLDYLDYVNGYYIRNMEPGNLLTEIETLLKKSDLSSDMRKKLTDIQNMIDENDNNYLMIYPLKR